MFFLSKFLPALLMPLSLGLFVAVFGQIKRRRGLVWSGIVMIWIFSSPTAAMLLAQFAERGFERLPATAVSAADAIVVLSSGRSIAPGPAAVSEWEDADRFFGGVELFQAGKAPLLIFTGALPYGQPDAPTEGVVMAGYARALGVPSDHIVTTGRVRNTADEAVAIAALSPRPSRILLVTSAYHMPRARRLFEHAGFTVEAFPVDFQSRSFSWLGVFDILPSSNSLHQSQTMIRELYGRIYYWARGY